MNIGVTKWLALFLVLLACSPRKGAEGKIQLSCHEEEYKPMEKSHDLFLPIFRKQFKEENLSDSCIRLYYIPSFEKEMLVKLCKEIGVVKLPDTGTIWSNIQIVNINKNGEIISGRVANTFDSIGYLPISEFNLSDTLSKRIYIELDSMGIWNMKSIEKKNCNMVDGIGITVESKLQKDENWFSYTVDEYKDKRYNRLYSLLNNIYLSNVKPNTPH